MTSRKSIVLISGLLQELNTPTDKLDFAGNTTTDLTEGSKLYYTDARARLAISAVDSGGDGSLSYDNVTGAITYTGPSASEVRAHFSVAIGSGLTYSSSTGVFGTSAIPNSQLANSSFVLGSTTVSLGETKTTLAGFTEIQAVTLNAGVAGAANNISIGSGSIVFEGATPDTNEITFTAADASVDRTITLPDADGTVALLSTLSAGNTGTGYGSLAYNSTTGAFTYSVVTNANIRGAISVTDSGGDGALAYDSGTGVITYTGPSASEVRAHFSVAAGSGLTYSSSTGEFGTSAIPNSQLQNSSITIGSSAVALGGTITTIAGLLSVTSAAIITNDSGFRVRNTADPTRQIAFDASGIATATTRTYVWPDFNGTVLLNTSSLPATFSDSAFRVQDNADATRQLAFECSGISTATTRTMTVPDESGVISTQDFATAIAIALG